MFKELKGQGIRVDIDDRDNQKAAWKYNHWEQRGVPIRLELGNQDLEKNEFRCVKRNDGKKIQLGWDGISNTLKQMLEDIHEEMYNKALQARLDHVKKVDNWKDFMAALTDRNICLAPWCNVQQCEKEVKEKSKEESTKAMEEGDADEA